jgi:hypothetical protein
MKQKKGADIINLENQRILDEENYTTDYALQTERERIRYEAELAAANKSGADTTLQMPKRISQRKIEENLQASKVAALGASLGIVSDILGKESAGKAPVTSQLLILIKVLQLVLSLGIQQLYQRSSSNCSWFCS